MDIKREEIGTQLGQYYVTMEKRADIQQPRIYYSVTGNLLKSMIYPDFDKKRTRAITEHKRRISKWVAIMANQSSIWSVICINCQDMPSHASETTVTWLHLLCHAGETTDTQLQLACCTICRRVVQQSHKLFQLLTTSSRAHLHFELQSMAS